MSLRQFEPETVWSDKDGLLTERAKGYLRGLFDYIGAATGVVPSTSLPTYASHIIEDDGVAVAQRATINFVGTAVSVADVGAKTVVTIAGTTTTSVGTSGTTVTIPKATTALVGTDVTYILTVPGYVDLATQGGDTVQVDGSQTTLRLDNDGASVTLRYLSTSTLGIV